MNSDHLKDLRRNYDLSKLIKSEVADDPIVQLENWLAVAIEDKREVEANAMMLATVDKDGQPANRVVLLKGLSAQGLIFYTNYKSRKGHALATNPKCAATFWWQHSHRQVRVEGVVEKISQDQSTAYFKSRPIGSQIGAIVSPQSQVIANRQHLEDQMLDLQQKQSAGELLEKPEHWGGYCIIPRTIEFWQGRENRLHDRLRYIKTGSHWSIERLAP